MADESTKNRMVFMTCCDHHLVDQQGKTSLIGLFGAMSFQAPPLSLPRFFIYVRIEHLDGLVLEMDILQPDGSDLASGRTPIETVKTDLSMVNLSWQVNGLIFPEEGIYQIVVKVDGNTLASMPLSVTIAADSESKK